VYVRGASLAGPDQIGAEAKAAWFGASLVPPDCLANQSAVHSDLARFFGTIHVCHP
jgi:hypothetical protein